MHKVNIGSSSPPLPVHGNEQSSPKVPDSSGQLNNQTRTEQPADAKAKAAAARARAMAAMARQQTEFKADSGEDSASEVEETAKISESKSSAPPIQMSVKTIYNNWQSSQKNDNIRRDSVDYHKEQLQNNKESVKPIILQSFEDEGGQTKIRTLDGRHRLTAAHELELKTIPVHDNEIARQVADIFGA
ncbi:ParB N-terminal domain-containing protein [Paraherbaspirillum soli]|uniref:ParB N-terminal domain-containing protein n=1 Tax=Paraherbaspirillum soli TaxID=631222 RepID=A0ABW0M3Q7_9BURK